MTSILKFKLNDCLGSCSISKGCAVEAEIQGIYYIVQLRLALNVSSSSAQLIWRRILYAIIVSPVACITNSMTLWRRRRRSSSAILLSGDSRADAVINLRNAPACHKFVCAWFDYWLGLWFFHNNLNAVQSHRNQPKEMTLKCWRDLQIFRSRCP